MMKSETRNPKPEGNPKAEIRRGYRAAGLVGRDWQLHGAARKWLHSDTLKTQGAPHFELRASDFGLPSGFGFRISDLPLPLPHED
jgi:hypothetical protein